MNHDDENELFERLESEMALEEGNGVVDLTEARSARSEPTESARSAHDESGDPTARLAVDRTGGPSGPGFMDRVRGAKRRPVLPAWATSKPEFVTAAGWLAGHTWHTAAYHGVRLPWYGLMLTAQSPSGIAQFVGGSMRWLADREGDPLRAAAARREDVAEYLKLSRQRDRRVRWRTLVAVAASVFGMSTAMSLYVLAPAWLLVLSGAMVTLALGWLGQPADEPVVHRAVEIPKVQKLTSDIVLRALGSLGIGQINQAIAKGRDPLTFTAPITRDGPGWRAEGDLPFGVTVADVVDKRDKLASGLRRPLGCVWPDAVPDEHTGRLVLWVGDQDMSKAKQPTWPLAKSGSVDLFKPVAFGTDQRGRWVEITLMYIAGVIGAIPRMGKTFLLRLLLLIAALDPRAELHLFDLKGTGDLGPLEQVAYRYRAGDDDEDILYILADLRELRGELRRRAKVIRSLPRDLCPESKVTSDLASKKSLGLHPVVVGVDECQVLFEHPRYGEEIKEICTDITKRGPALGFVQLLSTQRPDKDALPPGIGANASARFCLKVLGQIENDMVLGTGAYKRGVRATMFAWADKGIHYFVGEGADARIVRSVYADAVLAERIALRGRKLRQAAGTLAGHALGEEPEGDPAASYDLLADILAVLSHKESKLWSEEVASRLAELRPEIYGEWSAEQLTSALKPYGINTIQIGRRVDGKVVNRRGIARSDIANAVAERDGKSDAA
ncbi:cell division protein FtsK [Streptomyces winkii]|uniref:cell division protein FtsK n=1 Tax=Streptomyces winkii TaxID=3051178 RepID=UPI0028D58CFC|nr:cell division protein FtsK [Streptomyces sp. DSM 40971]